MLASALSISFGKAKQKAGGSLMVSNVRNAISRFIGGLMLVPRGRISMSDHGEPIGLHRIIKYGLSGIGREQHDCQ